MTVIKSGIYCIKCETNGRLYVGSAVNIIDRWSHHRGLLARNVHHNVYLQRAWNLYGEKDFTFEVLEYVDDKKLLIEKEQYWIYALKSTCKEHGFNMAIHAGSQLGFEHSEETKAHLSKTTKGKKKPMGFREKVSNTLKKKGIKPSKDAAKKAADARRGVPPSDAAIEHIRNFNKGKKQSADYIEKRIAPLRKAYVLTSPDGIEIAIGDLPQFCKDNNLLSCKICDVCRGRRSHHKGWIARYA